MVVYQVLWHARGSLSSSGVTENTSLRTNFLHSTAHLGPRDKLFYMLSLRGRAEWYPSRIASSYRQIAFNFYNKRSPRHHSSLQHVRHTRIAAVGSITFCLEWAHSDLHR